MPYDVSQLLKMTSEQLDDCFKSGAPGPIPNGEAKGTAIVAPGTVFNKETAELISIFTWKGKTFDAQAGVLRNRVHRATLGAAACTGIRRFSISGIVSASIASSVSACEMLNRSVAVRRRAERWAPQPSFCPRS